MTVPTTWRRQSLNKFLKSHVMSEHVGGRKRALEGIKPLSRCAVVQWCHGFFFGYASVYRFIGAKFEICYRDLNVGEEICKNYASTMTMVIFFHWLYFLCMQKSLEEKQVASGRGIPLFIGVIEACLFGGTSREEGREEVGFQAPKFWLNSNSNGSTCWVYWTSTWHVIWGKHCVRRRF